MRYDDWDILDSLKYWAFMLAVFWLLLFLIVYASGCGGGLVHSMGAVLNSGGQAPADSPEGVLIAKLNWVLPLCVLGVAASVFSLFMPGVDKATGAAGLIGSASAAVFAIILAKFAAHLAVIGLLIGAWVTYRTARKSRLSITGFIDGFQKAKDGFTADLDSPRDMANAAMASKLTPEAEKLVRKHKAKQQTADAMEEAYAPAD